MYKELSLKQLVQLGKEGDKIAKGLIVERFKPLLIKTIIKYFGCSQDFDDLLQEGGLVILEAIESYDCSLGVPFQGYVQKQTFYHYINMRKKPLEDLVLDQPLADGQTSMKDALPNTSFSIEDIISSGESREYLKDAIFALSPKQREVIIEYYFNKKSLKSMAEQKGLCYQSLVKLKSRGLKKLKDGLFLASFSIY